METLQETAKITCQVYGGTHPFTVGIEKALRVSRDVLAAREPPQYEPTFLAVESANTIVPGGFVEHGPVEHFCTSITAMPAYQGKSFEELRLEDRIRTSS